MQAIVLLPALLTLLVALSRGFRVALVAIALPALLLLPAYYTWKIPGIPEFSFHNYLLLAVGGALFLGRDRSLYQPHPFDLLVIAFCLLGVHSEMVTKDAHEARNLGATMLMLVMIPYLIGRVAARSDGLMVGLFGALALVGALIGWASPFEARMGSNPFDFWRGLWPVHVPWDHALYRAGIRRVAGPFAHPICNGFYFSMAIPLYAWLAKHDLPRSRALRYFIWGGLILGLLTAVSRGPILGAILAMAILGIGWSRQRAVLVPATAMIGLVGLLAVSGGASSYLSVSRGDAETEAQENAAYRVEMLDNYIEVVRESPWVGYGRYQLPVVKRQKSIDNQYLFLALTHGMPHAILFLALMIIPALLLGFRLALVDARSPHRRLGWALAGLLVGAILTQVTVFAGTQTAQLLMMLEGIAITITTRLNPVVCEGGLQRSPTWA